MPKPVSLGDLSSHDRHVLESIFNPLEFNSGVNSNNLATPNEPNLSDEYENLCGAANETDLEQAKQFELEGVRLAEQGQLQPALNTFEKALSLAPLLVSVYNNRAQALRLANNDEAALKDLNETILLASDKQRKSKCAAYCQRGILYRKQGNLDAARVDFEKAAALGSHFAKTQLVEINPYAALCNTMLRQAFDKLK